MKIANHIARRSVRAPQHCSKQLDSAHSVIVRITAIARLSEVVFDQAGGGHAC